MKKTDWRSKEALYERIKARPYKVCIQRRSGFKQGSKAKRFATEKEAVAYARKTLEMLPRNKEIFIVCDSLDSEIVVVGGWK